MKSHLGGRLLSTAITQADLRDGRRRADRHRGRHQSACSAWRASKWRCCSWSLGRRKRRSACGAARRSTSAQIAEQFGGGGHRAAAGVRFPGPLADGRVGRARRRPRRDGRVRSREPRVESREPGSRTLWLLTLDSRLSTFYDSAMNPIRDDAASTDSLHRASPSDARFLTRASAILARRHCGDLSVRGRLGRAVRSAAAQSSRHERRCERTTAGFIAHLPARCAAGRRHAASRSSSTTDVADAWTRPAGQRVGSVFLSRDRCRRQTAGDRVHRHLPAPGLRGRVRRRRRPLRMPLP